MLVILPNLDVFEQKMGFFGFFGNYLEEMWTYAARVEFPPVRRILPSMPTDQVGWRRKAWGGAYEAKMRWRPPLADRADWLIPPSLPHSPPCLIPLRLTSRKMRAQLVPREMMGEAASTTPFDGKKGRRRHHLLLIVKICIYIVTAEISASIHGESMRERHKNKNIYF